ncbi:MAG: DUF115 domain-containing protein [Rhabdochlamydiaceae bacterium]|nr:DUF115 domain-containing protein [Rhabdochlamydiaceae bacterium]
MELGCVGSELAAEWMERYPEIAFLISYGEIVPSSQSEDLQEIAAWRAELDLEGIDVLYVLGVGNQVYQELKCWLQEKKERMLIFLEEDLTQISSFAQTEASLEVISDPQVHLQLIQNTKALASQLKTLIHAFPTPRLEVVATPAFSQERASLFKKIRLTMLRECAVGDAVLTEALYSHQLVENVLANFKRWPHSFFANGLKDKFKNVPAIICGAGPSLGPSIPLLKTLSDRALIIAGGSTIAALSNQGVVPHIGMALDPNPEEYSRLRVISAYEMPFVYGNRVQPDVFQTCNGPFGYLHSFTGGPCEAYFEKALDISAEPVGADLGPEAFSVTAMAIALAVKMGCNPIILNGIDLAYTGMKRYAEGVMPSSKVFLQEISQEKRASEKLLRRKGIAGTMVYTLVKWVMESSCISKYAKIHSDTQFINVSQEGLGFKGIANKSLSQVIEEHCSAAYDLRSWVHAEIQQINLSHVTQEKVEENISAMQMSLSTLLSLCDEMLEELEAFKTSDHLLERTLPSGKMTLLQIDFEEEKAFECFFPHVGPALDQMLNRTHPLPLDRESLEYRKRLIERLITKWEHVRKMIIKELSYINQAEL